MFKGAGRMALPAGGKRGCRPVAVGPGQQAGYMRLMAECGAAVGGG